MSCVGLRIQGRDELAQLLTNVVPRSLSLGVVDGIDVRRWEDPSGARLILDLQDGKLISLLPSFAAPAGALVAGLRPLSDEVAVADVVDTDGETLTRLALGLEEQRFLPPDDEGWHGRAAIVALGNEVEVHENEDAFAASPASLLDPETEGAASPRMGAESFISFGLFGDPDAQARLHGTVKASERRVVAQTGQEVVLAVVQTAGFNATLCTPADALAWQPVPGNVLGGSVFMVGCIHAVGADRAP